MRRRVDPYDDVGPGTWRIALQQQPRSDRHHLLCVHSGVYRYVCDVSSVLEVLYQDPLYAHELHDAGDSADVPDRRAYHKQPRVRHLGILCHGRSRLCVPAGGYSYSAPDAGICAGTDR